ncbi:hypothetical protein U9M48_028485 [Paspalum notatum var. saurae]|uniref:Reverse transcriptase Ty1/copia-type domain-containing protein n=1 Tax=Paspalum notatum var. saurae TaxID=547442 RepID=A0AAQ3TVH8_PASNO
MRGLRLWEFLTGELACPLCPKAPPADPVIPEKATDEAKEKLLVNWLFLHRLCPRQRLLPPLLLVEGVVVVFIYWSASKEFYSSSCRLFTGTSSVVTLLPAPGFVASRSSTRGPPNGVVEHKHCHLLENRALMLVSSVPPHFWAEAVSTATYLANIQLSLALHGGIPFKRLCGKTLDYDNLRLFGCVYYVLLAPRERTKLIAQSVDAEHKVYRCWDPVGQRMRISLDVVFDESHPSSDASSASLLAMAEEIAALERTVTWDVVPTPSHVRPITCKWVYKVKTRSDGSCYKGRLVARGFQQEHGHDYDETFAPVAHMTTPLFVSGLSLRLTSRMPFLMVSCVRKFLCNHRLGILGILFLREWFVVFVALSMVLSRLLELGFNALLLWSWLLVFLPVLMILLCLYTHHLMVVLFFS